MSTPRYMIGTGYFARPEREAEIEWFFELWHFRMLKTDANRISILEVAGSVCLCVPHVRALFPYPTKTQLVQLSGDLGALSEILRGDKSNFMESCVACIIANAWLAYLNDCDFISVEQDVLCFGHWVDQLYRDCDGLSAVWGKSKLMGSAGSLMLVRHAAIPQFVSDYIATGPVSINSLSEHKLTQLILQYPKRYGYFSFGFDRDRPLDYDAPVWYAQKFTTEEMRELGRRGMVDITGMPESTIGFTNNQ